MNIKKPTIVIDEKRLRKNIVRMATKAKVNNVRLRPHFKTHQSAGIGEIIKDFGISAITVSSIDMAFYFAKHGWKDITIAIPANIRQVDEIESLAETISLGLLVDSLQTVEFLAGKIRAPANVWIEIDSGELRTGVNWTDTESIGRIGETIARTENLSFIGILTHAGQSYEQNSVEAIKQVHRDSISRMKDVQIFLSNTGFDNIGISVGDTPTCSLMNDFSGVTEIRPGNFVLNDLLQVKLGSCSEEDIAIAVACPVISKHSERNELIIYGGGVHLSRDFMMKDGAPYFGLIALPSVSGWTSTVENAMVTKLSQEHGTVQGERDFIDSINIGDILMIIPIHSCLTTNLYREYLTVGGRVLKTIRSE